jgi:large subunit ribosomal protein L25
MSEVTIEIQKRDKLGKGGSRQARNAGAVPAVVYGGGLESLPVQVDRKTMADLFRKGASENQIFLLKLAGTDKTRHAMIREMQVDPVNHRLTHIDFVRIVMTEKVRVQVPIELKGLSYGVKNQSAVLDFVTREVSVECLPGNIPAHIELDVTELQLHQHAEAKDLTLPDGVVLLDDLDRVIVAISASKTEKEAAAAAPAEGTAATSTEPEVLKKGKPEDAEKADKDKKK